MLRFFGCGALPLLVVSLQPRVGPAVPEAASCLQPTIDEKVEQIAKQNRALPEALEYLQTWLEAIEEHVPVTDDAALASVSRWSDTALESLWRDVLLPQLRINCDRRIQQLFRSGDRAAARSQRPSRQFMFFAAARSCMPTQRCSRCRTPSMPATRPSVR